MPVSPSLAMGASAIVVGLLLTTAPTPLLVALTVVAATCFRGIVGAGLAPGIATYFDIPLAVLALGAAIARRRARSSRPGMRLLALGLPALLCAAVFSATANETEPMRPVLYFLLLAEPFFLIVALLVDSPSEDHWRTLRRTVLVLLAAQVFVGFTQAFTIGSADNVQGTLYGARAGAHVMSGIVVAGGIWFLLESFSTKRIVCLSPLFVLPFIADAKQVLLALPVVLLPLIFQRPRVLPLGPSVAVVLLVLTSVIFLVRYVPAGKTAIGFLEQAQRGRSGKSLVIATLRNSIATDPMMLVSGLGPAETVSRAAFMTLPGFRATDSPLAQLGLRPAKIASTVEERTSSGLGAGSSFNTGLSSAIGLLGDLGLLGIAAYGAMTVGVIRMLRASPRLEAPAVSGLWLMLALLAFVFDWWEQPPMTIFLATLTGLTLTAPVAPNSPGLWRGTK